MLTYDWFMTKKKYFKNKNVYLNQIHYIFMKMNGQQK